MGAERGDAHFEGLLLPGFPAEERQLNTVGATGKDTLIEVLAFYENCITRFSKSPRWIQETKQLLDFGCAWSRVLRCFLFDFKPNHLYGIDVDSDLIEISKRIFPGPTFVTCDAFPPTALDDESCDFIVGYSVFSHLSEQACLAWMREFERLLSPGGMLALTTRGRWFFDYCAGLSKEKTSGYSAALANLFEDFAVTRHRYDAGEIVHVNKEGVAGGGVLDSSFYGETFIPLPYARHKLAGNLKLIEYTSPNEVGKHPIMFFQKASNGLRHGKK